MPAYLPNSGSSKPPPQWLVRLLSAVLAIGVLIIAVFLGGVILVTGAVLGVGLWGWLWWQKRKMLKRMEEQGGLGGQQWGPGGFGGPGAGPAGPSAGQPGQKGQTGPTGGGQSRQSEQIIEGDFTVLDDNDPRSGR